MEGGAVKNMVAAAGTYDDASMMKERGGGGRGERNLTAKRDAVASSGMSSQPRR